MGDIYYPRIEIRPAKRCELVLIAEKAEETNLPLTAYYALLECAHEVEPQHLLVAVADGDIAGYIGSTSHYELLWIKLVLKLALKRQLRSLLQGPASPPPLDPRGCLGGHVFNTTVYPPYRQHGIGRMLNQRVIEELEARRIRRWVKESNIPNKNLVEKMGFQAKRKSRGWIRYELQKHRESNPIKATVVNLKQFIRFFT
ncbi:MAG: GNAT family N-acetyltransferase [Chloroflexota bacterium]|nr:GNAT family N-acetyltransferase [Chloroflexota bacterium]